jgi:sulfite exporter TauE/SafE
MHLEWFISAFLIGLGGSLHCVGMCGPLMFANFFEKGDRSFSMTGWLAYQSGRILVYGIWGLLFGWMGSSVRWFGIQQNISIAMGISILSVLILVKLFPSIEQSVSKHTIFVNVRTIFSGTIHTKTTLAKLMGGMMNGFLPCGLVYVAWAGAAAIQDPIQGSLFMVFFGMGTLPLLSAVMLFGKSISLNFRIILNRWYPLLIVCMALMLIIRGMNMGNLFSPALMKGNEAAVHCVKK